jgi:hypothetical protein
MKRFPGMFFLTAAVLFSLSRGLRAGDDAEASWPPITPEELALKDDPINPGAPAILLYRDVFTDDTKREATYLYRIKVLKEEGKKYADVQIPYSDKLYSLGIIRSLVVSPDGRQVPFSGEVRESVSVKARGVTVQTKSFALPDVQIGSIIEYAYRLKWNQNFPDALRNPSKYILMRADAFRTARWFVDYELTTRRARFFLRPLKTARLSSVHTGLPPGQAPVHNPDGTVVLELQNIPGFQAEEYMPPEDVLGGRVDLYYYLGFWGDTDSFWWQQAKDQSEFVEKFLDKPKAIEKVVGRLVSPGDSPEIKLHKLYSRAQQIRALSYERERTGKEEKTENLNENKNVEDILNHGYGRGNEIILFFVALARAAGFQAGVVSVASRKSGFFRKDFPDASQLDAMVVKVRVGSKDQFFDPATRYCPYDLLPWDETGTTGVPLGQRGFGSPYISTPPPQSADAIVERRASLRLNPDGNAEGEVKVTFIGQEALERRIHNREADPVGKRQALEDEVKAWLPAGATVELSGTPNWEESELPLRAEFHLKLIKWGADTGRRMLLPLAIFQANEKHPFPNAKRTHPIYFRYPFREFDKITLAVPAENQVESLPAPHDEVFPSSRYTASWSSQGDKVQLVRRLVMDEYFMKVERYPMLRMFYDKVRAGDEEQIVLKATASAQTQ